MPHASAYSPSHVTGFFEILDNAPDELRRGSRGAGMSLEKGVRTEVSATKSNANRLTIKLNGEETHEAKVSELVARTLLQMCGDHYWVEIDHNFDVPLGTGFGTSGAGALSLSLALHEVLELSLSTVESAQIAHRAEIESKTGLGTVAAEMYGGVEMRLRSGAPGVGRILNIPYDQNTMLLAVTFGPISTTHILSTPWMRARINGHAHDLLWELVDDPTAQNLIRLSRRFSDGIGLSTPRVRKIQSIFDDLHMPATMLMLGEGVFSILTAEEADGTIRTLREKLPSSASIVASKIASQGARLLDS